MVTLLSSHSEKAQSPISVTVSGMVKEAAVFPIGYWIKAVFALLYNMPSSELNMGFAVSTFIVVRLSQ